MLIIFPGFGGAIILNRAEFKDFCFTAVLRSTLEVVHKPVKCYFAGILPVSGMFSNVL